MTKRSSHCEGIPPSCSRKKAGGTTVAISNNRLGAGSAILSPKQFSLIILLVLLSFFSSGCLVTRFYSLRDSPAKDQAKVHYVPVSFIPQKGHRCGPAVLAMALNYWGKNATPEKIAQEIYLPDLGGSLTFDLESYPQKFDLWSYSYSGNLSDLKKKLDQDIPVIALIGIGPFFYRLYHYALVVGYWDEENLLVVHSGKNKDVLMKNEVFLERWKASDYWTLLVCPPEKVTWPLAKEESLALARFYFDWANQDLEKELFENAGEKYRKALKLNPGFADACNNLAWVYYQQKKNLDEAVNLIQKALKLNPSHQSYYLDTLDKIKKTLKLPANG
ncbi:MAG: hypothetical protein AUJ76_03915 [Candidatus Omnitrophica bacterium CG1_02_41_171]|nr:MAG: hypothetical protein AUJ76_03915 [Candidatus Omnitrophica bacterium CG1_02_41_171]